MMYKIHFKTRLKHAKEFSKGIHAFTDLDKLNIFVNGFIDDRKYAEVECDKYEDDVLVEIFKKIKLKVGNVIEFNNGVFSVIKVDEEAEGEIYTDIIIQRTEYPQIKIDAVYNRNRIKPSSFKNFTEFKILPNGKN